MSAPLHIIELVVENTKRVRVARIRPDSALVVVGGRNAQGKSSLLDAIEMALGGTRALPPDPVRHGAKKARQVVDLGELKIERTTTSKGTALVVTGADGQKVASPQTLLDSLFAKVSFDPAAFVRMAPAKQDEILKELVPDLAKDLVDIERDRARLFEERTETNRLLKSLRARVDAMVVPGAGPDVEVSAASLLEEAERRRSVLDSNEALRQNLATLQRQAADLDRDGAVHGRVIAELEAELAKKREALASCTESRLFVAGKIRTTTETVAALVDPDLADVKRQLSELEETNRAVRARIQHTKLVAELDATEREVEDLTRAIEHFDEEKAEAIGKAVFPVPGLGFDDTGVTYNGVPLEQASQAERLRVSVAIGAALNPRLRVMLVREGSLLDDEGLALLADLARETGSQVWLEKVATGPDGCSVFLEDGEVSDEVVEKR